MNNRLKVFIFLHRQIEIFLVAPCFKVLELSTFFFCRLPYPDLILPYRPFPEGDALRCLFRAKPLRQFLPNADQLAQGHSDRFGQSFLSGPGGFQDLDPDIQTHDVDTRYFVACCIPRLRADAWFSENLESQHHFMTMACWRSQALMAKAFGVKFFYTKQHIICTMLG